MTVQNIDTPVGVLAVVGGGLWLASAAITAASLWLAARHAPLDPPAPDVVDAQALPLSQSPAAQRIRQQIVDNECARFRAELDAYDRSKS